MRRVLIGLFLLVFGIGAFSDRDVSVPDAGRVLGSAVSPARASGDGLFCLDGDALPDILRIMDVGEPFIMLTNSEVETYLVLYRNVSVRSWTLVMVMEGGQCIVAGGDGGVGVFD